MNAILPFMPATRAQIGRCGELLVQYRLLKHAIESSQMTTDTGIDLVAYSPNVGRSMTIQVKANGRPKPGGGKGAMALDWWIPENNPADRFALVDLASDEAWLFRPEELSRLAQQRSAGRLHLYFYTDAAARPRGAGKRADEFEAFKLENRIEEIFGTQAGSEGEEGTSTPSKGRLF